MRWWTKETPLYDLYKAVPLDRVWFTPSLPKEGYIILIVCSRQGLNLYWTEFGCWDPGEDFFSWQDPSKDRFLSRILAKMCTRNFFLGRILLGTAATVGGSRQVPGILAGSRQSQCLFHECCSVWFIQYSAIWAQRHFAKLSHQTTSVRSCSDKKLIILIIVWLSASFFSMQSFVLISILETEFWPA